MSTALRIGIPLVLVAAGVLAIVTSGSRGEGGYENGPESVVDTPREANVAVLKPAPELEGTKQDSTQKNAVKPERLPAGKIKGRRGTPPPGAAVFPDGTWLPPLNGVDFAPPFRWPNKIPYAPVVRIVNGDKNLQWYEHADGSVSTTQMAPTEQGGRKFVQPAWVIGNPVATKPVDLPGNSVQPAKKK